MAFWDSLGNTIKDAAENISEKVHHTATVNRVKMMISKEDKILQKELAALGTACFEQHKSPQGEADFSDFFDRIEKMQSRIVALQMKLHGLYMEKAMEKAEQTAAHPVQKAREMAVSEGTLEFENAPVPGAVIIEDNRTFEPDAAESLEEEHIDLPDDAIEENPKAEHQRESTISQLVDVVAEESGSPDHDSDSGALDDEIVSRNAEDSLE